jgi:hypothetical protein
MNFVGHMFVIQQHVQMDTKTSCSLPYKHGLSDAANAQKHVIYQYYILKYIVNLLFILCTTGVHKNILKLQHFCDLHRTKSDFQVAYTE